MNRLVLAAIVLVAACRRPAPNPDAWPAVPKSNEDARHIIASIGKRPTTESDAALPNEASRGVVIPEVRTKGTVMGFDAIDAQLARWIAMAPEKNVAVAFGTSHDSPAQIDAFRKLVGPRSQVAWSRVMLEQLRADGRWTGVDGSVQKGDDEALERYAKSGSREDLATLTSAMQRDTYTVWKYGERDLFADLLAEARASSRPVSGCDMAPALRARFAALDERWVHWMREVHCVHAMRDAAKKDRAPARVAVLWGRMHVAVDRFPRLVPPEWETFIVSILDAPASDDVILVDPIFPRNGGIVLASPNAAAHFERKRTKASGPTPPSRFSFTTKKTLRDPIAWIDGERFDGPPTVIAPGRHVLAVDKSGTMIAASIEIPPGGAVDVTVADDAPEVTATIVGGEQ